MALTDRSAGPACTDEGFLREADAWNEDIARWLAAREGLELSDAHWEILYLLRDFYAAYDSSPAMRALVKYTRQRLGEEKGRSIYLLRLFPGSPAKIGSKIAGLPKPANCL